MALPPVNFEVRPDIVVTSDPDLPSAMRDMLGYNRSRPAGQAWTTDLERQIVRQSLIERPISDPKGFERLIGASDLTSINFLDRGRRAARAVCRIRVPNADGDWTGTGFLAGPRLLITNFHVLASREEAEQAVAEFGYEHDIDGVLQDPVCFSLRTDEIFFADKSLDVCCVSVASFSHKGVPIERFGWLPLLPVSGKAVANEWVSIIQHPNGGPKQIAVRASQIVELPPEAVPGIDLECFIHYSTDTEPGSSGAPVVNDQWQVVAIHHKAIPNPVFAPGGKEPEWIGNEGVRVSALFGLLDENRLRSEDAMRVRDRLDAGLGFSELAKSASLMKTEAFEADGRPFKLERWTEADNLGYDPDFLGKRFDLAPIYAPALADDMVAPLLDNSGYELRYRNFSSVIHEKRCFPLITAVNIDGAKLINPGKRAGKWRIDARMDAKYQPAGNCYEVKLASEKVYFSRGHMVRRVDPCWGDDLDDAKEAEADTFHYANAAPQFQTFNDVDWGNLEDYILDRAQMLEKKITVFTGCIFRRRDPLYGHDREGGPWRIPVSFWKIAVIRKSRTQYAAAAFIMGQTDSIKALYEARVFSGLRPYKPEDLRSRKIQTTIAAVEEETGLDFSALREFDNNAGLEASRRTWWVNRLDDIQI